MEVRECHDKGVGICPLKKNLSFGFLFKQFLTSVFVFSKEIDCSVVGGPVAGGTSKVTVILCLSLLFSQLFVRPPQTAIFPLLSLFLSFIFFPTSFPRQWAAFLGA